MTDRYVVHAFQEEKGNEDVFVFVKFANEMLDVEETLFRFFCKEFLIFVRPEILEEPRGMQSPDSVAIKKCKCD